MFQTSVPSVGEHRLNVAVGPDNGPTLLLLHGVTRSWNDWINVVCHLTPRWQVVAFDFRGHGESEPTRAGYRVADYVQDALSVLRQIAGEPTVVVGHSLGAMVAAAVAAELPRSVRAVVLEDPPFHTMGDRIAQTPLLDYFRQLEQLVARRDAAPLSIAELARTLADVRMRSPDGDSLQRLGDVRDAAALRFAAACLSKIAPALLAPITAGRWLDGYDVHATVRAIRCPVLLLQADAAAGGMLTDVDAEFVAANSSDCVRHRFPGTGHLIHGTDAAAMLRVLVPFLESLRIDDGSGKRRSDSQQAVHTHAAEKSDKSFRIDTDETRHRHDSHSARPVN